LDFVIQRKLAVFLNTVVTTSRESEFDSMVKSMQTNVINYAHIAQYDVRNLLHNIWEHQQHFEKVPAFASVENGNRIFIRIRG